MQENLPRNRSVLKGAGFPVHLLQSAECPTELPGHRAPTAQIYHPELARTLEFRTTRYAFSICKNTDIGDKDYSSIEEGLESCRTWNGIQDRVNPRDSMLGLCSASDHAQCQTPTNIKTILPASHDLKHKVRTKLGTWDFSPNGMKATPNPK